MVQNRYKYILFSAWLPSNTGSVMRLSPGFKQTHVKHTAKFSSKSI